MQSNGGREVLDMSANQT